MSKILIASNNQGKLREIQALLDDLKVELLTPAKLGIEIHIPEEGKTYAENASLKGEAFAKASGMITLADDSGLEVDALDGLPGLRSARFAPKIHATDKDRREYLLHCLSEKPPPWSARFRCVLALVVPGSDIIFAEGICPGEIISQERGTNGFGYDPVFLIPEIGKTMAELSMQEKNNLSHRARAVRALIPQLTNLLSEWT
jgi:XTP/dITP diphosphohydrolase